MAKPVTRTLLMVGGEYAGFVVGWTEYIEAEANRHLGPNKVSATEVRSLSDLELWTSARNAEDYPATNPNDRQVLADAVANNAWFVITEDVDDFDEAELVNANVAAVNPDLFLSKRLLPDGYQRTLELMCTRRSRYPNTPPDLHASLGRQHPLLVAEFIGRFEIEPLEPTHPMPAVLYRGSRCIRCGRVLPTPTRLVLGTGPECRNG